MPIVAVVDTNCDPDVITYVIPGNDDAIRSGALMCRVVAEAVVEGRWVAEHRPAPPAPPASATATGPRRATSGRRGRRSGSDTPEPPSDEPAAAAAPGGERGRADGRGRRGAGDIRRTCSGRADRDDGAESADAGGPRGRERRVCSGHHRCPVQLTDES